MKHVWSKILSCAKQPETSCVLRTQHVPRNETRNAGKQSVCTRRAQRTKVTPPTVPILTFTAPKHKFANVCPTTGRSIPITSSPKGKPSNEQLPCHTDTHYVHPQKSLSSCCPVPPASTTDLDTCKATMRAPSKHPAKPKSHVCTRQLSQPFESDSLPCSTIVGHLQRVQPGMTAA